jgi:putative Holliday junction resolvase
MPATPDRDTPPAAGATAHPPVSHGGSLLAFDYGTRRIGIAVGSPLSGARALTVVEHAGGEPDWRKIDALLREWQPAALVVGLPLSTDGGIQAMTGFARDFADALSARHALPVHLVDERYSSLEASRRFAARRASGTARRKDAAALDAVAAQIILETWLGARQASAPEDRR